MNINSLSNSVREFEENNQGATIVDYLESNLELDFDLRQAMTDKFAEMETSNSRKFNFRF